MYTGRGRTIFDQGYQPLYRAKALGSQKFKKGEWVEGLPGYGMDGDGDIALMEVCEYGLPSRLIDIDPDTLCEYTGYTDEHGKKLFDADFFTDGEEVWQIQYDHAGTGFIANGRAGDLCSFFSLHHITRRHNKSLSVKLLGNPWDNSELQIGRYSERIEEEGRWHT